MPKNKIHFIITGGTIDSHYDGAKDTAVPNKQSVIPSYFKTLGLDKLLLFQELFNKDSRDLTSADQKKILKCIESSPCKMIIITHGIYTMPDTSRYIEANVKRHDQTIVLTGSVIPIEGFSPSDGPFNLGFAFSKVQDLPDGVYIAMHGIVYKPGEVAKDMKNGKFYSVFGEKSK